jgi:ankyrin repeat protein
LLFSPPPSLPLPRSPLHLAAAHGHDNVVLLLVDQYHANTNAIDDDGRTPLHDASAGGHTGAMRILLTQGRAKIGIKKVGGKTAVHLAAARGVVSALKLLVQGHQADVGCVTARGDSALHISSQFGKNACITVLIENGSDLLLRNSVGQTALDVARAAGKHGAVVLLERAMESKKRQGNN